MCPTCGGAQSEPGGWSGLTPHPGTPLLGTRFATVLLGRIPHMSGPPREGGGGGGWTTLVPPTHSMLTMTLRQQQPCSDLYDVLWALDPHPLSLPIRRNNSRCTPLITHHLYPAMQVAWMACHNNHLTCIFPEESPVKEVWRALNSLFSLSGWVDAMSP